jgi:hypothetical protein
VKGKKKNPIYLFYEVVANGPDGTPGDDGDTHYRCLHGAHKTCTIKKSMRSNLSGAFSFRCLLDHSHKILSVLLNNLRVHVHSMYQFYCVLKDSVEPPTPYEIDIASGKRQLDAKTEAEYLKKLQSSSEDIKKAFRDQEARAIVSEIHPGLPWLATYDLTTGAMGPGEVRATRHGMGHCV